MKDKTALGENIHTLPSNFQFLICFWWEKDYFHISLVQLYFWRENFARILQVHFTLDVKNFFGPVELNLFHSESESKKECILVVVWTCFWKRIWMLFVKLVEPYGSKWNLTTSTTYTVNFPRCRQSSLWKKNPQVWSPEILHSKLVKVVEIIPSPDFAGRILLKQRNIGMIRFLLCEQMFDLWMLWRIIAQKFFVFNLCERNRNRSIKLMWCDGILQEVCTYILNTKKTKL